MAQPPVETGQDGSSFEQTLGTPIFLRVLMLNIICQIDWISIGFHHFLTQKALFEAYLTFRHA